MVWIPGGEKSLMICLFVLTESTNKTDTQTDGQTPHDDIGHACTASRGKNSLCTHHKDFHLTCNMLLQYRVKVEDSKNVTDFDSTSTDWWMFLRTLWGLDLTFNNSWTDGLKTDDIEWLTNILKFIRRCLESTAEPYSVKRRCIMAIFSPWLSLHRLSSF